MTASHAALFRRLFRSLLLCALGGGPAMAEPTTQPSSSPVLAFGSADRYWVASVEPYREATKTRYKTLVRGQTLPAGDWKDLGVVFGRAVNLAQTQGELAILLDDGDWKRIAPGGLSTGPAIPGSGPIRAWGSAGPTLYAVRAVEGGKEGVTTRPVVDTTQPTTAPATRPATQEAAVPSSRPTTTASATSQPTTRPTQLVLLRYDKGQWIGEADLPANVPAGLPIAVTGVGNKPLIALATDGAVIRTDALADSKWEPRGEVRPGGRAVDMDLIAAGNLPALWTTDQDGQMKLFLKREGEEWAPAKSFALPAVPAGAQRTLAAAGEEFRLVVLKDNQLWEQRYDSSGAPRGSLSQMPAPQTTHTDPLLRILQSVVLLGMVVIMLVTFYKRRAAAGGPGKQE